MAETAWTNDRIIQLVKEYEQRPILWDSDHEHFRTPTVKYSEWFSLASLFQCDVTELKRKLNSIQACYRKERARVKTRGTIKWYLYPHLTFLPGYIYEKNKDENVDNHHLTEFLDVSNATLSEQSLDSDQEEITDQPQIKIENIKHLSNVKIPAPLFEEPIIRSSKRGAGMESQERKVKLYRKRDDCDIFGEYIASCLRKHDELTRTLIKQGMNNILFEQDMKKYGNSGEQGYEDNPIEDQYDDN